jgi:hypothetical protein
MSPRTLRLMPITRPATLFGCLGLAGVGVMTGCETLRGVPASRSTSPAFSETARASSSVPALRKPGKHWLRVSQYVFYSDLPLAEEDPLFRELETLPEQIQQELQLPPGTQVIQVFLFDTQEQYESFMRERYPWLPVRRAYFIADQKRPGAADELIVYTWLGDHLRTDLRHELTHAFLHGVLKAVPLWLDEGLAGFFEQPLDYNGVNPSHLDALRRGPFQPNLARLEKLGQVKQMEKAEYREAWAWVHFCLRGDLRARNALLKYLARLRELPNPGPFLPELHAAVGNPEQALHEHLERTRLPSPLARGRCEHAPGLLPQP